ncbi:uncharacterized protein [Physcomitrium patens]|uniref:uncharacterized protein n=1 Tax=Physcomitrium patens TaxID=3218 RepID=UPI003CCE4240
MVNPFARYKTKGTEGWNQPKGRQFASRQVSSSSTFPGRNCLPSSSTTRYSPWSPKESASLMTCMCRNAASSRFRRITVTTVSKLCCMRVEATLKSCDASGIVGANQRRGWMRSQLLVELFSQFFVVTVHFAFPVCEREKVSSS